MSDPFACKEYYTSNRIIDCLIQILFTYTLFYLVKIFYDIISTNLPNSNN